MFLFLTEEEDMDRRSSQ